MASRKYGALVPEHRPPDPDITRDVPDTTDVPEVSFVPVKLILRKSRGKSVVRKKGKRRDSLSKEFPPSFAASSANSIILPRS